jgi:hypothetical protein
MQRLQAVDDLENTVDQILSCAIVEIAQSQPAA